MGNYMEVVNALALERKGNGFVGELEGYAYSFVASNSGVIVGMIRFVFEQAITKDQIAIVRKSGKLMFGLDSFANQKDTAVITVPAKGRRTLDQYAEFLKDYLLGFVRGFQNAGLLQPIECTVCHQEREEEPTVMKLFNGYHVRMHETCADKLIVKVTNEVALENKRWYLVPISVLFAFLGGLVGLIPAMIALFGVGYYLGILFALVPLAAVFGYKLGKAPQNIVMIVSVVLVALVLSGGFIYVTYAMIAGMDGLTLSQAMAADAEFAAEFESNLTTGLIFGALGVFIAWRSISKTSVRKLDAVQELKRQ